MTDPGRLYHHKALPASSGWVVYWMQRDQRVSDNWALVYASEKARESGSMFRVVFCLTPEFLGAALRQYLFMIRGLQEVEHRLGELNIPFDLLTGDPGDKIPDFCRSVEAGLLVTDFNPLRITLQWKKQVAKAVNIQFTEVDAHNIMPCRTISGKQEYSAFTFRKKVEASLPRFLKDFAVLKGQLPNDESTRKTNWNSILDTLSVDRDVGEVTGIEPGELAARNALSNFIETRLETYDKDRNFPERQGQSGLSPWLHFGHLSAQRAALEVQRSSSSTDAKKAFLEELIVRRELADNFCFYNPNYDNVSGFQPWAKLSLDKHRDDIREATYSFNQFERGLTHDPLWNAAQMEMVYTGKMHGYMRMYWAKKILEWTPSPEEAIAIAIYLNDKYQLDGRDPNGYAGIAWSVGGVHDRPWGERKVFGMIRYMNYNGCRRKFNVDKYIEGIKKATG